MTELSIASINVRGLGNNSKRREVFNWLRNKRQSIYFLQEAHCTEQNVDLWRSKWGYEALFSCCSGSSAGVAILFNNNFNLDILKTFSDPSGRFIICDIKTTEKLLTIANIYAPNEDNPDFFEKFFDHLYDFRCEEIILGGDFNLVLDVEKDKKGGLPKTYQNALKVINQKCWDLDFIDIWRTLHPNNHRYTWHRRKPEIHCRLDFFLISSSIVCDTNLADILPGYKTDHSMIQLTIVLHHNPRGRGLWRLNTSLLKDEEYVEQIKIVIEQTRKEYELDDTVNPSLLWDVIKMKVREKSVSYAAIKSSRTRSFNKALKSIWIKKYLDGNNCGKWKLFFDSELERLGGSNKP